MRRQSTAATNEGDRLLHGLRVAQHEDILRHQARRGALVVCPRLLDPGAVAHVEQRRDLVHHIGGHRLGEIPQVVGIQLPEHADEGIARGVLDQRLADAEADFGERLAGQARSQFTPDNEPIADRQGLEDMSEVGGVQGLEAFVKLHQVLPVLHFLQQRAPRRVLPARDGLEKAVLLEQAVDFGDHFLQAPFRIRFHAHRIRQRREISGLSTGGAGREARS